MLLTDAAVIPLYFEHTYYAVRSGVSGLHIIPPGEVVLFKNALKAS